MGRKTNAKGFVELRTKIEEVCGTSEKFAEQMGVTPSSISQKMHGKRRWAWDEIMKASAILKLDPTETMNLFTEGKA